MQLPKRIGENRQWNAFAKEITEVKEFSLKVSLSLCLFRHDVTAHRQEDEQNTE